VLLYIVVCSLVCLFAVIEEQQIEVDLFGISINVSLSPFSSPSLQLFYWQQFRDKAIAATLTLSHEWRVHKKANKSI